MASTLLRSFAALRAGAVAAVFLAGVPIAFAAQDPPIKGEAALKHPAGQAAVKAAELITAGKLDEAMALRTKEALSEWKMLSTTERKELGEGIRKMTPDPKVFAEAIRKGGELSIMGNSGVMNAETGKFRAVTYFAREGGAWKVSNGPIVFPVP